MIEKSVKEIEKKMDKILASKVSVNEKIDAFDKIVKYISMKHIVFIPNWYNREHFELMLNRELTTEEYYSLVMQLDNNNALMDECSEMVEHYLYDEVNSSEGDEQ